MVDIQTISIAIASASIVIAVVYYILQIRHQAMMRQIDLVMRLYERFSSNEFQVAWQKVRTSDVEKYSAPAISDHPKGAHALSAIYRASFRSSATSLIVILFSTSNTFTASSNVVMQYGQATAIVSTPRPRASCSRLTQGLFSGSASSVQTLPAPPPQQKLLCLVRFISTSCNPGIAWRIFLGAS